MLSLAVPEKCFVQRFGDSEVLAVAEDGMIEYAGAPVLRQSGVFGALGSANAQDVDAKRTLNKDGGLGPNETYY